MRKLLAKFQRDEEGVVALEIAASISLMGFGFIGLMSAMTFVDSSYSAQRAVSDVTMTARSIPDLEAKSDAELKTLFETIATETLMSTQSVVIDVGRSCGCPLEQTMNVQICTTGVCADGLPPSRYVTMDFEVTTVPLNSTRDAKHVYNLTSAVQY